MFASAITASRCLTLKYNILCEKMHVQLRILIPVQQSSCEYNTSHIHRCKYSVNNILYWVPKVCQKIKSGVIGILIHYWKKNTFLKMQGCCARRAAELGNVYPSHWVLAPDLYISNTGAALSSAGILSQQGDRHQPEQRIRLIAKHEFYSKYGHLSLDTALTK